MKPVVDSLVLYKIRPARVLSVGEKIEIELEGGQSKRVRPKDISVLHSGPLRNLDELQPHREGELEEAWELLDGGNTHIEELTELIYGDFSPATAWAAWQWVADGLYFSGTPTDIAVRSQEEVERDRVQREAKAAVKRDWEELIARLEQRRFTEADRAQLGEVESVALGRSEHSRILKALGLQESREHAHRLLLGLGYWEPDYNPYPARFNVSLEAPELEVPELPEEERRDFTSMAAFAIDDEGNQDPDDAISLDGDRIWVHVADVAALAPPDSPIDLEARARGANLYAPERIVPMLPDEITRRLGLGMSDISPAISFGFRYAGEALSDLEIVRSQVRVRRLSYQEAETRLEEEPFRDLLEITGRFRAHRHARDAAAIDLPEVSVRVVEGEVRIRPLPRLRSRNLVTDAMLMAGEAAARFCRERDIAIPYATQEAPGQLQEPEELAAMWAYRRQFKPSRLSVEPAPHFGLGLDMYARATSPLRRYSDLLLHQQLRAHLRGEEPLSESQVAERVSLAETGSLAIRRAERLSNTHWKLVWLRRQQAWKGEGVVVEQAAKKFVVLIPELALDVKVRVQGEPGLNSLLELTPREIDLPDLISYFSTRMK
jgi:exoribonuclease-2